MRVTRISVLAVPTLIAGLLGTTPASAADPVGTVALFAESNGRAAWDVAIAPGEVAWVDNGYPPGGAWSTELVTADLTGSSPGAQQVYPGIQGPDKLSLSGGRWTSANGGSALLFDPAVDKLIGPLRSYPADLITELSGDRLLTRSGNRGDLQAPWALNDLRTGQSTPLPAALSYDLWGDRLVRLDFDGSVSVLDLRTGGAPVQVRAPSADVSSGKVLIAGDIVAWQITPSTGSSAATQTMTRNLGTMAPAAPLSGLTTLVDLSTGYAVGSACSSTTDCRTAAVSLADGSTTTFDQPASDPYPIVAVDGNEVAFVSGSAVASLFALPAYADQPRLLGSPAALPTVSAVQPWTARVLASRVMDSCHIEIRDAARTLVRVLSCLDPHAAATVTWDGRSTGGTAVPDGSYTWRIVGATGGRALTDYDGSTSALTGTVTVVPAITAVSPATNTLAVPQTTNVTTTFSAPVTGVNSTTFVLKSSDGTIVPSVVSYNATTRIATLTPSSPLVADARYTATLTGGTNAIRDGINQPVPSRTWSFVTGPAPRPIAYSPHNLTDPPVNSDITVTFSEDVQNVSNRTFTLRDSASTQPLPATVTYDPTTRTATLNPDSDLTPHGHYVVALNPATLDPRYDAFLHDAIGNLVASQQWDLIAGPGPTVIARTPGVNATGAKINGNITATFSQAVRGVSTSQITLTSLLGTKVTALVTYNATNHTVTLNPLATLGRNVKYRVTVVGGSGGVTNLAGDHLTTTWWIFTTGTT